ncbi:MAG: diguanylate cyclase [Sterolibacterium sp.]|nr:diguanylate cyclase [Sterolibacterium sp.]
MSPDKHLLTNPSRHVWSGNLLLALVLFACSAPISSLYSQFGTGPIALFWPLPGIALASLLLGGYRYWPGVLAGAALSSLWINGGFTPAVVLVSAGSLAETLCACWYLCRQTGFSNDFDRLKDFGWLIVAAASSCLLGPTIGLFPQWLAAPTGLSSLALDFLNWWQGDFFGMLFFTPLILVWRKRPGLTGLRMHAAQASVSAAQPADSWHLLEWLAFLALSTLAGQIIYCGWWEDVFLAIARPYWSMLFIAWAALRFDRHSVLLLLLINILQVLSGVSHGKGYFAIETSTVALLNLSLYHMLITLVGIALSLISHERKLATQSLREQAELSESIVQSLPGLFYMLDDEARLLHVNQRLLTETGYEAGQLLGASIEKLLAPETSGQIMNELREAAQRGEAQGEALLLRHDGKPMPYFFYARHCRLAGQPRLLGLAYDISQRALMEEALRSSEHLLQSAIGAAGDVIWDWNAVTNTIDYSARWKQLLGYTEDTSAEEIGAWNDRIHPDDRAAVERNNAALLDGQTATTTLELRLRDRNGQWKWTLSRGMVMQRDAQGRPLRIAGTLTDISQLKAQQQKLEQLAHFDPLTGVPNRFLLNTRLQQTLGAARPQGQLIAISYMDLDGFKEINDTYGHDVGDSLLVAVTQRLRHILRECDMLARIGGDEFVILMADLEDEAACRTLLQRLLASVCAPIRLNELKLQISASIGVTLYPNDAASAEQLLRHADQAMYQAKQAGKNRYCIYVPDEDADKNQDLHAPQPASTAAV